jgi:hypothetical protein
LSAEAEERGIPSVCRLTTTKDDGILTVSNFYFQGCRSASPIIVYSTAFNNTISFHFFAIIVLITLISVFTLLSGIVFYIYSLYPAQAAPGKYTRKPQAMQHGRKERIPLIFLPADYSLRLLIRFS